jgi:hypothetical protein
VNSYKARQNPRWYLDKFLFIIASTYLFLVVFWLVSKDKLKLASVSEPQTQPTPQEQQLSPSETKFIAYMERSLEQIASNAESQPEKPMIAVPATPTTNTQTIIEKIYVPVYPQERPPTPSTTPSPAPPQLTSKAVTAPLQQAETASTKITLVGLLESSDRGYALFDINGTTRRFERGDPLGTSGWTLVGIQNQQAIVYANGTTRSLEVGQGF